MVIRFNQQRTKSSWMDCIHVWNFTCYAVHQNNNNANGNGTDNNGKVK